MLPLKGGRTYVVNKKTCDTGQSAVARFFICGMMSGRSPLCFNSSKPCWRACGRYGRG